MKSIPIALLLAGLCAAPAWAGAAAEAAAPPAGDVPGGAARSWLQLQADGSQASARRQTLSGETMDRIYNRYLRSFTLPIPARLTGGTGTTGGSGTGSVGGNAPTTTR